MKNPKIGYTKTTGFNNNNNFHKLNETGLYNAYNNINKVHVDGDTLYVAGTSNLNDVYDDISKIPFYGDLKKLNKIQPSKNSIRF